MNTEQGIQREDKRRDDFKKIVRQLVLSNPAKIEARYKEAVEALEEIREEFNL